jgi:hypothetical protein
MSRLMDVNGRVCGFDVQTFRLANFLNHEGWASEPGVLGRK